MNINRLKLSGLIFAGSLALTFGTFAASAIAQSAGKATANSAPSADSSATSSDGSAASPSVSSSKLDPKPGANNDPALKEPKPGPTGAPGVATESGSVDANGMHLNATAPMPTP